MCENNFLLNKDLLDNDSKAIINYLEGKVDSQFIKDFLIDYSAGEEGLAYENLSYAIVEEQIKLSKDVFILIKKMCFDLYLDFKYWMQLESLVIGNIKKCSDTFGKIHFPKSWTEEKVKKIVLDILDAPKLKKIPLTTKGNEFNKDGLPARFSISALKDRVFIRVIVEPEGIGLIAYYPLYGNGVTCRYLDPEDYDVE